MKETIVKKSIYAAVENKALRSVLKSVIDREVRRKLFELKQDSLPAFIEKRYQWFSALIERVCINLDRGIIRSEVLHKAISAITGDQIIVDRCERLNEVQENYKQKKIWFLSPAFCYTVSHAIL